MSRHPPLTPQEKSRIKSLRDSYNLTGVEIARRVGRSKSAVYKHLQINAAPNWTDREVSILTEYYLKGVPAKKIARRLKGRTPLAVRLKMCRYRKKVNSDPDISRAAFLLRVALSAGLSPGRAIQKIRISDAYGRLKYREEEN